MNLLKKSIIYILATASLFSFQGVFAGLTYESVFVMEVKNIENTQGNIDKAKLLEKYAGEYRKETKELQAAYSIPNSPILMESIGELEKMIVSLKKIQIKGIEKQDADEILSSVIEGLRGVNASLKPYMKKQQDLYKQSLESIKKQYIKIGEKISQTLYNFIQELSIKLKQKENLSENEKEVVMSLVRLNENRQKIEAFKTASFKSKSEMKSYYINILRSMQKEIKTIRSLLK